MFEFQSATMCSRARKLVADSVAEKIYENLKFNFL